MKKSLFVTAIMASLSLGLFAQSGSDYNYSGRVSVSAGGGVSFLFSENVYTYKDAGKIGHLARPRGFVAVGYDFNEIVGLRCALGYGQNASAMNVERKGTKKFMPYYFNDATFYADAVLNLNGLNKIRRGFAPKVYAGLGAAYSHQFSKVNQKRYSVNTTNFTMGWRVGFIAEYNFSNGWGLFADLCGEGLLDNFNGVEPKDKIVKGRKGYPGFPFDMRGTLSAGLVFHF